MTNWKEKGFDFAGDVTKQLIALATGVVTITVTFSKDILLIAAGKGREILMWGWIAFLLSVLAGLGTLLALTGQLEKGDDASIWAGGVRMLSGLQILLFLVGIVLSVVFIFYALGQEVVLPAQS